MPLGLLSIASYLESKGHTVKIYDRTIEKIGIESVIRTFNPELVEISIVSYKSIVDALNVAKTLK